MNMLSPGEPQPFRLRIEDYELLDRAGAFVEQRVELIEGVVIAVNAELSPHTRLKNALGFRLQLALLERASIFSALVEPTLSLPPHDMPQPDVVVAKTPAGRDYYRIEHLGIVIEVAATTLRSDLGVKRAMYAGHAVPEYWVVDVEGQQVHQFWSPDGGAYAETRLVPLAGDLRSATIPGLAIDGAGIL